MQLLKLANFDEFNSKVSNESEDDKSYFDKFDINEAVAQKGNPYNEKETLTKQKQVYYDLARPVPGNLATDQYDDLDMPIDESRFYNNLISCEVGVDTTCSANEECVQLIPKSRQGICNCAPAYVRNEREQCVRLSDKILKDMNVGFEPKTEFEGPLYKSFTVPSVKKLTVSVVSKKVRLPEQEVTLAAYTIPDEKSSGDTYKVRFVVFVELDVIFVVF